jgi:nicotinamide-nucleotide amidase
MKGLMIEEVLPRISKRVTVPQVVHRTIMTQGVGESFLAELIKDWESGLPDCVKLAYLPRPGIVRLRLSASGKCAEDATQMLDKLVGKLLDIIPQHVFGFDDISLEQALGDTLKERSLTVSTAESCTGGKIAHLLTSVPGSSGYFSGSVVAYQNEVKASVLKVENGVINRHGAVSKQVVELMARGVMKALGSDTAMATSGVAGPDGGSEEKPVGTTWISVSYKDKVFSKKYLFGGTRERIIDQASYTAIQLLRRLVLDLL